MSQTQTATSQQQSAQNLPLDNRANPLAKMGGFSFVESVVDGIANMNPERKARKQMFLTDNNKAGEREDLAKKIQLWIELLENNDTVDKMVDFCKEKSVNAVQTLKKNLKSTLEQTRELEVSYRTVAQFYKNTELDKVDNVNIEVTSTKEAHYVPKDDELVTTLMDVYRKYTGDTENDAFVLGGGTYARCLKKGVAFGLLFPGKQDTMHQANEFLEIEDLLLATAIYAEGIYKLCCE